MDRHVVSLNGDLAITVDQNGTPTYQYSNLHGDIMGTAAAGATSPTIGPDYDEFGNAPVGAGSSRYGWLGGTERSSDVGGLMLMGARLYAPALRSLSPGRSNHGRICSAYDYCNQDPINVLDLAGLHIELLWAGTMGDNRLSVQLRGALG